MGLRLTGLSTYYLFQTALNDRNQDVYKSANELSSGKRITTPSDDPDGTRAVLSYRDSMDTNSQYIDNLKTATRDLSQAEVSLSGVKDIIVHIQELALQGANGTLVNADGRAAIAQEIAQNLAQLQTLANTQIDGKYIFGGFKNATQPFTVSAQALDPNNNGSVATVATYNGDTNTQSLQITENATIQTQLRGDLIFKGDGTAATVDLFQTIGNLKTALLNGDFSSATSVNHQIDNLKTGLSQVLNQITTVGSLTNRIDTTQSSLEGQNVTLQSFVSGLEDADVTQTVYDFQRTHMALQTTIQSAGAVMNLPSLFDFIGK